jgi:hypothetical protein
MRPGAEQAYVPYLVRHKPALTRAECSLVLSLR